MSSDKCVEINLRNMNLETNPENEAPPQSTSLTVVIPPPDLTLEDIAVRSQTENLGHYLHMSDSEHIPPPKADFSAPPPYDVATNTKLPTYEEVQREKQMQGESPNRVSNPSQQASPLSAFLTMEPVQAQHDFDADNGLLGTDFMFFTAFFIAFLFNWIGFLLLMCFCHTIASRYGALSGFGLSLAKWTLIVKHSTELASHDSSWLCWLIMAFGLLICIRAIIQYLNIKRGWRLLSGNAQERLLFFH